MAQQDLQSPHSGIVATITPGDPLSRTVGQYGKGATFPLPTTGGPSVLAAPAGGSAIRDQSGGLKTHPKTGGLGAGPNGSYGSNRDYGAQADAG
jgi:hypothetical protein